MYNFRKIIIYVLISGMCLAGCTGTAIETPSSPSGGEISLHAIHSDKLRDIMYRINALIEDREQPVTYVDEQREIYMQSLIDTAGDLAYAAEKLTLQDPSVNLGPDEKIEFRTLARELYENAVNLHLQAMESNFMEMDTAYQKLDQTCNNCHRLFRSH